MRLVEWGKKQTADSHLVAGLLGILLFVGRLGDLLVHGDFLCDAGDKCTLSTLRRAACSSVVHTSGVIFDEVGAALSVRRRRPKPAPIRRREVPI